MKRQHWNFTVMNQLFGYTALEQSFKHGVFPGHNSQGINPMVFNILQDFTFHVFPSQHMILVRNIF